jgi:hypothetical protein
MSTKSMSTLCCTMTQSMLMSQRQHSGSPEHGGTKSMSTVCCTMDTQSMLMSQLALRQ